jgi:excisionase family DNA binding protein
VKTTQPQLPLDSGGKSTVDPTLLTVRQAAQVLGIGRSTLYELIAAGVLETVAIGRARRVPHEALVAFVAALRAPQR